MMRLFSSSTSPFVRKVLVVARELGLENTIEAMPSAPHPVKRDANVVARNPLGKVPTAVLDDGSVLFDSRVIVEYLVSQSPAATLLPPPGPARWRCLTQQALADGILDAAVLARYETTARPPEFQWSGWREAQLAKVRESVGVIELSPPGDEVTIGTIAIGCALGYLDLRYPELNWRDGAPATAKWYAAFAERPAMRATRPE